MPRLSVKLRAGNEPGVRTELQRAVAESDRLAAGHRSSGAHAVGRHRPYKIDPAQHAAELFVRFFADTTDAQSRVDFSNTKADSVYWLDNVSIVPVRVAVQDSQQQSPLFYNASALTQAYSLQNRRYRDLDGKLVTGSISLAAFMSKNWCLTPGQPRGCGWRDRDAQRLELPLCRSPPAAGSGYPFRRRPGKRGVRAV